jgi:type I restriction enzyme, S subunit
MSKIESLLTDHLELWSSAIKRRSTAGRGSSRKIELYGIKKLRELILDLAVRGLLVPQDPKDEPASVLLKKIAAEKSRLVKEGKIKKEQPLPAVNETEWEFNLPHGWAFERIGSIVSKLGSGSTPRGGKDVYTSGGIRFLRSQNIWNEGISLDDIAYISRETHENMSGTKVLPGDVLLNITGASLGRTAIFPEELVEANVSQHVTIIRLFLPEMVRYFHLGVLSPLIQRLVWGRQVGMAIGGLSKKVLEMIEFPIPPLAEQHRIVAKVDELMALCDQLENQSDASLSAHETLVETLLKALTSAADHAQFASAWERIGAHFDTLFTTEESIDQLKQSILQLAVMGKLVPQDPKDEPASVLLKKIAAEKAKLVKEGKIKKEKVLPSIGEDEKPFEVPRGWVWVPFDEIINQEYPISYGVLVPGPEADDGIPFVRIEDLSLKNPQVLPIKKISIEVDHQFARTRLTGGEILMGVVGSIGKLGIAPTSWRGANIARAVCRIVPIQLIDKEYIVQILQSTFMQGRFIGDTRTLAQPTLNIGLIRKTLTPIPPLAEQHRIVAKVDELMALCDQLNSRLAEAQLTQLHLADALTEKALAKVV